MTQFLCFPVTILCGADLYGADLRGAHLRGVKNIISFGPVGNRKRIGYAVKHKNCVMVQLGCFWGTLEEAAKAIRGEYGEGSSYEKVVTACASTLTEEGH